MQAGNKIEIYRMFGKGSSNVLRAQQVRGSYTNFKEP